MDFKDLIMPDIPDWLKNILATENTCLPLLSYKQGQITFAVALIDANGETADLYFFNGKKILVDEKKIVLKNEIDINSDFCGQKISQKVKAKLVQNLILSYNLMTSGENKDECKKIYRDYCNEIQKIMPRNASEIYNALDSVYNIKFYNLQDYKDAEISASENLSEVTASELTALEALSNYIMLLPVAENARKGMLKFSAPEICAESDFDGDEPKLLQILRDLKNNEEKPKERKIGTIIGKTINRKCGACDDCAFDFCPYIKSAYLKYLREYNPERLTSERSDYAKKKKEVERSEKVKVKLAPPTEKVNRKSIANAVKDLESLNISIALAEGKLAVTTLDYFKPDGTKLISNRGLTQALSQDAPISFTTSKVDLSELAKEEIWKGEIHDDNGEKLDRRVAYAVIAWTTIKQVGSVDDLLNFEPKPKEEITAEVQSEITEVKKSAKIAKKPITKPKTEQKRIVAVTATIPLTPQNPIDIGEYLGKESKAYKYLTSGLDCFYGVLVVGDCKENESGLLERLKIELKKKNLDLEVTFASDLEKDFMFEPKKAKILVGTQKEIKDYLEVHDASKGLTTRFCIWTDLQAKDLIYNGNTLDFVTERFEDYPCEQKHIKDWVIYNITEI